MSTTFEHTRALVTGGTSGIGQAVAETLAAGGADVLISGRDTRRGEAVVAGIHAGGGKARFVEADLASSPAIRALAAEAKGVNVLINNAAIFPFGATADVSEEDIDSTFAVNVKAPIMLTGALAPGMVANGGGAIVNISTMVASIGLSGTAVYSASKAAIESLTRTWAHEYTGGGVRVNAVAPGPTRTPGTAVMGDDLEGLGQTVPAKRVASPQEIADAVVYLASPQSSYVTGAVLAVDGGRTAI